MLGAAIHHVGKSGLLLVSSGWSVAVGTCVVPRAVCTAIFANTRRLIVRTATGRRIAESAMAGRSLVIAVAVVFTIVVIRVLGEHARHHILNLHENLMFTSLDILLAFLHAVGHDIERVS